MWCNVVDMENLEIDLLKPFENFFETFDTFGLVGLD